MKKIISKDFLIGVLVTAVIFLSLSASGVVSGRGKYELSTSATEDRSYQTVLNTQTGNIKTIVLEYDRSIYEDLQLDERAEYDEKGVNLGD